MPQFASSFASSENSKGFSRTTLPFASLRERFFNVLGQVPEAAAAATARGLATTASGISPSAERSRIIFRTNECPKRYCISHLPPILLPSLGARFFHVSRQQRVEANHRLYERPAGLFAAFAEVLFYGGGHVALRAKALLAPPPPDCFRHCSKERTCLGLGVEYLLHHKGIGSVSDEELIQAALHLCHQRPFRFFSRKPFYAELDECLSSEDGDTEVTGAWSERKQAQRGC